MLKYKPVSLDELVIEHIVRTAYIGFMLSEDANEYIGKQVRVNAYTLEVLLENFNTVTKNNYYKVKVIEVLPEELQLYVLGTHRYFHRKLLPIVLDRLNTLLMENLKAVVTQGQHPLVFDINTLQPLERTAVTTMGDKYKATNNEKYTLHFFHLYDLGGN